MGVAKYSIRGTDYIGAYANACDKYVIAGAGLTQKVKRYLDSMLGARIVELSVNGSDMAGIYARGNSNGIIVSNIARDYEIRGMKNYLVEGENLCVLKSNMNAVGNNILANDKIALINPDYDRESAKQIGDALGVETVSFETGRFKTVGANNILTNKGLAMNNRSSEEEIAEMEKVIGMKPVMTTVNTGGLGIGLGTISNGSGILVGDSTTGFELARIMDALDIDDNTVKQ